MALFKSSNTVDFLSSNRRAVGNWTLCSSALLSIIAALPAMSQTAPASTPSQPAGAAATGDAAQAQATGSTPSGEIIVTARRQAESLRDVPLAVSVLSAETLQEARVENLGDAAALTAGLLIAKNSAENSNGNPLGGSGVIRGIVDLSGVSPTVSTFFNGVYLPNQNAVSVGIIDMERIEVVKGPVSALYGRGAYAGVINYVLRQPSEELSGRISGEIGNGGKRQVVGSISGAVVPGVLRLGLSGTYDEFDGVYRDRVNGLRAGGHTKRDGRISFLFTPTPELRIFGGFYYGDDDFGYAPQAHLNNNCGRFTATAPMPGTQFAAYCGRAVVANPVEVADIPAAAGQTANSRRVQIGDFHVEYDAGAFDTNLIFGYNKVVQSSFQDFSTFRNGLIFPLIPGPGTASLYELFGGGINNRDFSLEARISSKQNQPFRWAVGAYGSDEKSSTLTLIGIDASRLPAGQTINPTAALFLTPTGAFSTSNFTEVASTDRQISPFASVEVDPVESLTVFGEVRYVHQTKTQDTLRNSFVTNTVRPFGPGVSGDFDFVDYRVGGRLKLSPTATAYATVASGSKAGGFNPRATIPSELLYDPEKNTTYEIGLKSEIFDRRLRTNIAAYYINDSNLQSGSPSDDPKNVGTVTKNFGGFTSKGFEIEALAIVSPMLSFTGALAYNDAKFSDSARSFSPPAVCTFVTSCAARLITVQSASGARTALALGGLRVPYSTRWIGNAGINLKGDFSPDLRWFARAAYRYESPRFNNIANTNSVGPRHNLDLSTSVARGPVELQVYVDNVTDNQTPSFISEFTRLNDFGVVFVANLPDPRQYGARLTFRF